MTASPPVDRRLFGFAGGVWAASLVALRVPPAVAWAGVAACAGAAWLAAVVHRRRARAGPPEAPARGGRHARPPVGVWVLAGVLLGGVCGFAATGARTAARDAPALSALVARHPSVTARLAISGDPARLRGATAMLLVPARLTEVVVDGASWSLDVRVLVFARDPQWARLLPSQVVAASGRLAPALGGDLTAAVLTANGPPQPIGDPQWTQSAAGSLRAGLRAAVAPLPAQPGGLLPGLSIGDTSLLDDGLAEDFRTTGLTHLTSVSGANMTIVVGFVLLLTRWLRLRPWQAAGVASVALVGFVILVRPSPSVVRAAAMGAVGLLALVVGRSRVATAALAAAVVGSLLADPALAVSSGFTLSVLATGALVLVAPGWRDRLRAAGVPRGLAEAFAVPAAAQVACAPVIVALSGEVSLVALPANLLATPAVVPVTVLGVGAAAISPIWPAGAAALAWLGSWPAWWLVVVARTGAAVPGASLGWAAGWIGASTLVLVGGGVWFVLRHPAARRVALVVVLAALCGAAPVRWFAGGWPPAGAVVVACDVGQGDALVLPDADGSAVVVDAGPDPALVDRCLRRLGITTVDVVVLSHFHADHIDGLAGVLRGRAVGRLVVASFDEPAAGAARVRAAALAASIPVVEAARGWTWHDGDIDLAAIAPTREIAGSRSDPNNNSLVLLAHVRGVSILLPGDAEVEEQQNLLRDAGPAVLRVDVLKVAHHGSSYQDNHMIDATGARVALVSVGADNPYGHPYPALLAHLREVGMRVMRTDQDGDVAVVLTAQGLGVVGRQPGR